MFAMIVPDGREIQSVRNKGADIINVENNADKEVQEDTEE